MRARNRVLQTAFGLLYGPLAGFHEFVGRLLFGKAWHVRRRALVVDSSEQDLNLGLIVDLGCGEGRFLAEISSPVLMAVGIEPSRNMGRRAVSRGVAVIRADAQHLPLRTASVSLMVCTYPGLWLFDPRTLHEIERVMRPGARLHLLIGGSIERGPFWKLRALACAIVYGKSPSAPILSLHLNEIDGGYTHRRDAWGEAVYWFGIRR